MRGKLGQKAEEMACAYLQGKGYQVVARNYHSRWGEIDLICRQGAALVFVEVRSKRGERFGHPEESINQSKINKIRKTAYEYLNQMEDKKFRHIRFDFIAVTFEENKVQINHMEGAF